MLVIRPQTTTLLLFLFCKTLVAQAPFITTWKTDNPGSSCNSCITIPTTGGGYDYDVDWDNDGVYDQLGITGEVTHDFGTQGMYTIAIRGDFPRINFDASATRPDTDDHLKILNIAQWGDIEWSSMDEAFAGCANMICTASDNADVSRVNSLFAAFAGCARFNGDISGWNVSNVTDMTFAFAGAEVFNQDISAWDVGKVESMRNCFAGCTSFNQPIGNWDVSKVEDMSTMFRLALSFNQDIGQWDVSSVSSMSSMFYEASSFNQDIGSWDVSSVGGMAAMFYRASSFDHDLGAWAIGRVPNFNAAVGSQDTSFTAGLFDYSGMSCLNYSSTLAGWANNPDIDGEVQMQAQNMQYNTAGTAARQVLISKGWTITGDIFAECIVVDEDGFITTWRTTNPGTSCNSCITIPTHSGSTYNYDVDWNNDGIYDEIGLTASVTYDFGTAGTYSVGVRGIFPRIYFNDEGDKNKLTRIEQWGSNRWESMEQAFEGCSFLDFGDIPAPDLSRVTSMRFMFSGAENLSAPLNHWDVSRVDEMGFLFRACTFFDQDLDQWDVSRVENMSHMFERCRFFNGDISTWDVSRCEGFEETFSNAESFDQDISSWDVSSLRYADRMFRGASQFNQDLSTWDVSSADDLSDMFSGAESFDADLGDWQLSAAVSLGGMLDFCGLSCDNYSRTLIAWAVNPSMPDDLELGADGLSYSQDASAARNALLAKGWEIVGDTQGACAVSTISAPLTYLVLYPNPVSHSLHLSQPVDQLAVIDVTGSVQLRAEGADQLDMTALPAGLYIIQLVDTATGHSHTTKVIKYD